MAEPITQTRLRALADVHPERGRVLSVFLNLDQKWQYIFQGLLIVAAAVIYSQVRRRGAARA